MTYRNNEGRYDDDEVACRFRRILQNVSLMVGPVVQGTIVDITLRLRTQRLALVEDVAKMYRMVLMNTADRRESYTYTTAFNKF